MRFKDFAAKRMPIVHPYVEPKPKTVLKWKVGAKFKRPIDHVLGGEVLHVWKIDGDHIYADEDHLFTHKKDLELVA